MKYSDFSMKKADTLFMSVVKHPVHGSKLESQAHDSFHKNYEGLFRFNAQQMA